MQGNSSSNNLFLSSSSGLSPDCRSLVQTQGTQGTGGAAGTGGNNAGYYNYQYYPYYYYPQYIPYYTTPVVTSDFQVTAVENGFSVHTKAGKTFVFSDAAGLAQWIQNEYKGASK